MLLDCDSKQIAAHITTALKYLLHLETFTYRYTVSPKSEMIILRQYRIFLYFSLYNIWTVV